MRLANLLLLVVAHALHSALLALASEFDYTVEIPPGKMSCYFQTVTDPKYHAMEIDYQVGSNWV